MAKKRNKAKETTQAIDQRSTARAGFIPAHDLQRYKSLDYEQKLALTIKLSHTANQRLRTLEKKNLSNYSKAYNIVKNDRDTGGKVRFSERKKYESENLLDIQLARVVEFLNKESSTVPGAREGKESHEKRLATFKSMHGIVFNNQEEEDLFFDYLRSDYFVDQKNRYDSHQIIDDIAEELDQGYTIDQVLSGYKQYLKKNQTTSEETKKKKAKAKKNGRLWSNAKSSSTNKKREKK